jgi:hypothetical protein
MQTLGVGLTGRVRLAVQRATGAPFALKALSMAQLVGIRQEHSAVAEREMLSRIELLGARPPTELYNGAMLACAATEQWTLAAELFTRMHRLGVPRDAASYSAVIWACHVGTGAHEGARTKLLLAVDHLLQEPAERAGIPLGGRLSGCGPLGGCGRRVVVAPQDGLREQERRQGGAGTGVRSAAHAAHRS